MHGACRICKKDSDTKTLTWTSDCHFPRDTVFLFNYLLAVSVTMSSPVRSQPLLSRPCGHFTNFGATDILTYPCYSIPCRHGNNFENLPTSRPYLAMVQLLLTVVFPCDDDDDMNPLHNPPSTRYIVSGHNLAFNV